MTNIFITCISTLNKSPEPIPYNNGSIEATQTNEACCKYLLKRGPRPNVIIALCTRDAIQKDINGMTVRSYDHFKNSVKAYCKENALPDPTFYPVRLFRNEERKNHFGKAITQVLNLIQEVGERTATRISVDTAGGPRNISIMMQTMTRLLHYYGYSQVEAYYTNLTERRIFHDHTNRQLAITEAIATFVEHGTAHQLASYFRDSSCQEIHVLLKAMEEFADSIQICQTEHLPVIVYRRIFPALDRIETLSGAQANQEDVAALKQMVNYIRHRFGYNPFDPLTVTPVYLIKWCLENGYVQQAVTLFTENVPKYLVESETLIVKHPEKYPAEKNNSKYCTWLYLDVIESCRNAPSKKKEGELTIKLDGIRAFTIRGLHDAYPDFRLHINPNSEASFRAFLAFYVYIKKRIRNHLNHAKDEDYALNWRLEKTFKDYGIDTGDLTPKNITDNLLKALDLLGKCMN